MPHWVTLLAVALGAWFALSIVASLLFGRMLRACSRAAAERRLRRSTARLESYRRQRA